MPDNELRIAVRARDFATQVFGRLGKAAVAFERKTIAAVRKVGKGFTNLIKAVTSLRTLLIGFITTKIIQGLGRFVTSTTEWADSIAKLNEKLGLSTEFLSEMAFAAERSGVEFTALATGFQRAIRRMEEFRDTGKGVAADALVKLGGGLAEAVKRGESFERLLPLLADRFKRLGSDAERVRLGFKLFDTEGVKLVQLLRQGSGAIEELRRQAAEFGLTLDREGTQRAAAFQDALTNLSAAFGGIKQTVIIEFLPLLTDLLTKFANFIRDNRDAIINFFLDAGEAMLTFAISSVEAVGDLHKMLRTIAQIQSLRGVKADDPNSFLNLLRSFDDSASFENIQARLRALREEIEKFRRGRQFDPEVSTDITAPGTPAIETTLQVLEARGETVFEKLKGKIEGFTKAINEGQIDLEDLAQRGFAAVQKVGMKIGEVTRDWQTTWNRRLQSMRNELAAFAEDVGAVLGSHLGDAIVSIIDKTKSAKEAFKDLAKAIINDLIRIQIQAIVTQVFSALAGGIRGGGGTGGAAKGGIFPGSLAPVTGRMQRGGVARRRGLFELREGGQNEAVVPLPDNRSIPVRFQGGAPGSDRPIVIQQTLQFHSNFTDARGQQRMIQENERQIVEVVARNMRENFSFAQGMRSGALA